MSLGSTIISLIGRGEDSLVGGGELGPNPGEVGASGDPLILFLGLSFAELTLRIEGDLSNCCRSIPSLVGVEGVGIGIRVAHRLIPLVLPSFGSSGVLSRYSCLFLARQSSGSGVGDWIWIGLSRIGPVLRGWPTTSPLLGVAERE